MLYNPFLMILKFKDFFYKFRGLWHFKQKDFAYLSHPLFNRNILADQLSQKQIVNQYVSMRKANLLPLPINQVGWRAFSQFDEDGILLYIFSIIGTTNRLAIEIGADCSGDFLEFPESNITNLIVNHDWQGLIVDASAKNIKKLTRFFKNCRNTSYHPPALIKALVDRQNINQLIKKSGLTGEIDLFSLDVDSNDYWLFQALEIIQPRVLVLEFNQFWQSKDAVTIPYQEDAAAFTKLRTENTDYFGASLEAMTKLAKQKGYRLVALNSFGHNAFFVKANLGKKFLPTLQVKQTKTSYPESKKLEWVRV
jgi:hypothetical protein